MLRRTIVGHTAAAVTAAATVTARRPELEFKDMHGFTLKGVHRVDDLNLVAYEMEHAATAAQCYHVDINDNNNTFCIGFRTPAENDKGTSHVLEHTTLCGSKKYPVRDPFFMMLKRSLSNFMNAMTGADYTLYPFATTNARDFSNLLDIYLNAVFQPLLREEDFKQEGHRVETTTATAVAERVEAVEEGAETTPTAPAAATSTAAKRLQNNGVVYNEMRGVVSEPGQHYMRCLMQEMLPGTHYAYVSGGYPPDILQLTYDELVSFHARHYHPSNSITFTYGDRHPESHLRALNEYFTRFERSAPVAIPTLPASCRFSEPKVVELEGPLDAMGNAARQKRVSVCFGVPQEKNKLEDMVALSVLDSLLSSGPSSPMYKALIESQIGSKYAPMRGYAYYLSSPIISYGVAGVDEARPGAEAEVLAAVKGALASVQADGFDPRRVRSVVFQEELQQRHRTADYGVNLCTGLCAMGLCRSANSPLDFINWLPHLRRIEEEKAAGLLPMIDSVLLDNPHRAVVSVSAKKEFLGRLREQLKTVDDDLNAAATPADVDRIDTETTEWLKRVRAPQNKDVLPTLTVADIPALAFAEPEPRRSDKDVNTHTIAFPTNGLVYVHGLVPFPEALAAAFAAGDVSGLNPNVPLVWPLFAQTGAGKLSFKDFSVETELACGGFSFSLVMNESYAAKGTTIAGTRFGFYTTKEKLAEALALLSIALLEPRTAAADPDVYTRALSAVKMSCSNSVQSLQQQGNLYALTSAVARLTARGAIREHWGGLAHSRHATELLGRLQGSEGECRAAVEGVLEEYAAGAASVAASMHAATVWATCEPAHQLEVELALLDFRRRFPSAADSGSGALTTHLPLAPLAAAANISGGAATAHRVTEKLPIDTSFVGYAIPNGLSWASPDQAAVRIACPLVSNEYLHRRVREEGGAYGSGSNATLQGEVGGLTMSSYRDPTPKQTITAFAEAGAWLADAANVTEERLTEAKLRLFSSLDSPYAADSFGEAHFLNDVRQPMKQMMRDSLLAVSTADVGRAAAYFAPTPKTVVSVLEPSGDDTE